MVLREVAKEQSGSARAAEPGMYAACGCSCVAIRARVWHVLS